MSESKHTPGPWYVDTSYQCPSKVRASNGRFICDATLGIGRRDENMGNARLIAAAPATLAALEAAVACGMVPNSSAKDGGPNHRIEQVRVADQIRAAIAQAKGER